MVRLKNRYLLVNILYPELDDKAINAKVPDVVKLNQPTTNSLTPGALVKGLRAEIATLFGDYGSGAVADSLSGQSYQYRKAFLLILFSQISLPSNVDLHPSNLASTLQNGMGSAFPYEQRPRPEWQEVRLSSHTSQWDNQKS